MAMKGLLKQMTPWRRKTVAAGVEIFCLKCKERTASTNVEAVTMKEMGDLRPRLSVPCAELASTAWAARRKHQGRFRILGGLCPT